MIEIVVSVYEGVVWEVFCSDAEANLTIVDWDREKASTELPDIVEVKSTTGRSRLAHVERSKPAPISSIPGTDIETALRAAKLDMDGETIKRRYVLYDFDADELASTQLYGDYADACDVANELNNVLVLKLELPGHSAVEDGKDDKDDG